MSRARHLLVVCVASLPLLVLCLVVAGRGGVREVVSATVLWAVGVAVVAGGTWREVVAPLTAIVDELGAGAGQHARWRLRELKEQRGELERRHAEQAQLLDELMRGLGEGVLIVDADLEVRMANPRGLHFVGAELLPPGVHLLDLVRTPEVVEAIRSAAAGRGPERALVENRRGLWEVSALPLRAGGALVLATEVSLLRRAAELRRRFVQDLSHELRSPLAVLRTSVEAMEGEVAPQLGEMMVRQVERITRLTDELYELATIEAGGLELNPESLDLGRLAGEVAADFKVLAERAGVSIEVEIPDGLELVSDRRGLNRVLSNLLDNAVKYNRSGGWVRIRGADNGDAVRLEIADSGEGIPSGELAAVQQRFYRLDRARTPGRGGLGLGLAIVKHMVQQLGGTLALDSREGVGTQALVNLPKAPRSAGAREPVAPPPAVD